jgi:hypothetical protein
MVRELLSRAKTNVQYLQVPGRQDGRIISINAQKYNLKPYDVVVLAATPDDIQMGKTGRQTSNSA